MRDERGPGWPFAALGEVECGISRDGPGVGEVVDGAVFVKDAGEGGVGAVGRV